MTHNSMSTARGYNLERCPACSLPLAGCICALTPRLLTRGHFWLLIHPKEYEKPTNTARLIRATLPHSQTFLWRRTEPPAALLALLATPSYAPYVIFPQGDAARFTRLLDDPWQVGKTPAFLLLDGSWTQARRMFLRSAYLRGIPCLSLAPTTPSAYTLRRQVASHHLSTVEAAIAVLGQLGDTEASRLLDAYFRVFMAHCWAARHGHAPGVVETATAALYAYKQRGTQGIGATDMPP